MLPKTFSGWKPRECYFRVGVKKMRPISIFWVAVSLAACSGRDGTDIIDACFQPSDCPAGFACVHEAAGNFCRLIGPDAPVVPDAPPDAEVPDAAGTTGPATALSGPDEGSTSGKSVDFTYSAEAGAHFECSLDSPVLSDCGDGGATYPELSTATHVFRVQAVDALGNPGPMVTRTWNVDATPPVLTVTPFALDQSGRSGTVLYTADEPASFACRLDGDAAFAPCPAGGFVFSGLAAGPHTLTVHATDAFMNTSADQSYAWTVTGPVAVTVLDEGRPLAGAFVDPLDPTGKLAGAPVMTGPDGRASLAVPAGGMVSTAISRPQAMAQSFFTMMNVQPFDEIVLGTPAGVGDPTIAVSRTLPSDFGDGACYQDEYGSPIAVDCLEYASPRSTSVAADARDATGNLNLLVAAESATRAAIGFGWVSGVPVGDGITELAVDHWVAPTPETVTMTHIPAGANSASVSTGIMMEGLAYSFFSPGAFAIAPPEIAQFSLQTAQGLGEGTFYSYRVVGADGSEQLVVDGATSLDWNDALPVPADVAVSADADSHMSVSWSGAGGLAAASGMITHLVWSGGETSYDWTIFSPVQNPLVTPDAPAAIDAPSSLAVGQLFVDVSTWDAAAFRAGIFPLWRWSTFTAGSSPMPTFGPDSSMRRTRVSSSVTVTRSPHG